MTLGDLNEQQREAVLESLNHNIVLLASAGSGKTRTIIKRAEWLIEEQGVDPSSIMLVTFTNKAANEMRNRLIDDIGEDVARKIWLGTFHGICGIMLRKFGSSLNLDKYTILDSKDADAMLKEIYSNVLNENADNTTIKIIKSKISKYKNNFMNPAKVQELVDDDKESKEFVDVYKTYLDTCWIRKSFDFDDLILYTILMISNDANCRAWIQNHIKYVTVDEVQDNNVTQFMLTKLFGGTNNIMCVGDISQSIYGFRNARPDLLEHFAKTHPNTKIMKLEYNYRSTGNIIKAANAVINNNSFGEKVNMKTNKPMGELIGYKEFKRMIGYRTQDAEAMWIASECHALKNYKGIKYNDIAVICRTNLYSRNIEKSFIKHNIPYVTIGSTSFWSSKEMRDILGFCKAYFNPYDIDSFKRSILTLPSVAKKTVDIVMGFKDQNGYDTHEVLKALFDPANEKVLKSIKLTAARESLRLMNEIFQTPYDKCSEIADYIIYKTPYCIQLLNPRTQEEVEKFDKLKSIITSFEEYEEDFSQPLEVLDQISLMAYSRGQDKANLDAVKILTTHACKGLEFDTVFVTGLQEEIFPHFNSLNDKLDPVGALEEERRVFYVAITRAKRKLYLTCCTDENKRSRFIDEIPSETLEDCF